VRKRLLLGIVYFIITSVVAIGYGWLISLWLDSQVWIAVAAALMGAASFLGLCLCRISSLSEAAPSPEGGRRGNEPEVSHVRS
jgi:predicted permease